MKHIVDMELDGIDLSYGYNVVLSVDEDNVIVTASTVYCGQKIATVCEREMPPIHLEALNEDTIFGAIYDCMRDVQRRCERLHEGC